MIVGFLFSSVDFFETDDLFVPLQDAPEALRRMIMVRSGRISCRESGYVLFGRFRLVTHREWTCHFPPKEQPPHE